MALERLLNHYMEAPQPLLNLPTGLSSHDEVSVLSVMAAHTKHHVLEYGPFSGRSTVGIAAGMRSSRLSALIKQDKMFLSIDLFPQEADSFSRGYFKLRNYWRHVDEKTVEICLDDISCSRADVGHYNQVYKPVYTRSGGQLHWIMGNLAERNLTDDATIMAGTVVPPLTYSMIFADTCHSHEEFLKMWNGYLLKHIMRAFNADLDRFWLAMHDQQGGYNCCLDNVWHGSDPTYPTGYGRTSGSNIPKWPWKSPDERRAIQEAIKSGTCCWQRNAALEVMRNAAKVRIAYWKQIDSLMVIEFRPSSVIDFIDFTPLRNVLHPKIP